MSEINLIYAQAYYNVIGKDNTIPWHIPADMKYFKEMTMGHTVVMGRKTWESIPEKYRPLPGRINIVVTRDVNLVFPEGVIKVKDLKQYLVEQYNNEETNKIFLIGGEAVLEEGINLAKHIYLTEVLSDITGDIYAPRINLQIFKTINLTNAEQCPVSKHCYRYVVLKRNRFSIESFKQLDSYLNNNTRGINPCNETALSVPIDEVDLPIHQSVPVLLDRTTCETDPLVESKPDLPQPEFHKDLVNTLNKRGYFTRMPIPVTDHLTLMKDWELDPLDPTKVLNKYPNIDFDVTLNPTLNSNVKIKIILIPKKDT